jgi:putative transposase
MTIEWIPRGSTRQITAKEQGNRGYIPSDKVMGGIVEYESCLERDLFLVCNHAPDVVTFQHQPITINYTTRKGTARKYTPDVFIEFIDGDRFLIEVKYEAEVKGKGEKYRERWERAREWGTKRNVVFSILTEREIRTSRWYNVWFTLGASKSLSNDRYIPALTSLISVKGEKYGLLCSLLSESEGIALNKAAQIICYAIYHGLVFLDTFSVQQISNDSVIRKKHLKTSPAFKSLKAELGLADKSLDLAKDEETLDNSHPFPHNGLGALSFRIPDEYESIVEKRKQVVRMWLNRPKNKRTSEWRAAFCKKWKVSERTIYYWVKSYQDEGIEGLIPRHRHRGRQTVHSEELANLLENARQSYFKPLNTLKKAYKLLDENCEKAQVPVPNEASFRTFIYRNSTVADFAKKRGKKFMKSNFSPSLASFQGACAPMHVLQLDNTDFDVFPVDSESREGLPTPNMTAAIDCYTRLITGFDISYFPSSGRTVLDVLVQSILPKEDYTRTYDTQSQWPIQGFPVLILVDNGMDYRSKLLKEFCMKYGIILEFAPIRTPRFKAFIERWFNILRNALVDEDVLGYRPLLKQRLENPELKPEAEAILTLQEIESWAHKWVLDEYHLTNPYEDRTPAPYLRWEGFRDAQTKVILPLPREPPVDRHERDGMYLSKLQRIERTLGYHGVTWEHLTYNNPELSRVYKKIGKQKVIILLDQRDIRNLWVVLPDELIPLNVGLASGWAQAIAKIYGDVPIHASAWKNEVKLIKAKLKARISPFLYQKEISRIKREELLRRAKNTTKRVRKEQEKARETRRKSITTKIQPTPSSSPEEGISKEETREKLKDRRKQIDDDWETIPTLPTDDFPEEV